MSVDWWDINGDNAFSWLQLVALKTDWFAEERDDYKKKKIYNLRIQPLFSPW